MTFSLILPIFHFLWKIIQQTLEGILGGSYENLEIRCFDRARDPELNDFEYRFISKKPFPTFELSKQELYVRRFVGSYGCLYLFIGNHNRCTNNCVVRKRNICSDTTTYWT
ncbi:unnamed protein product, partial [Vitis vinifera]